MTTGGGGEIMAGVAGFGPFFSNAGYLAVDRLPDQGNALNRGTPIDITRWDRQHDRQGSPGLSIRGHNGAQG